MIERQGAGSRVEATIWKNLPTKHAMEIIKLLRKHKIIEIVEKDIDELITAEILGIYSRIEKQIKDDKQTIQRDKLLVK